MLQIQPSHCYKFQANIALPISIPKFLSSAIKTKQNFFPLSSAHPIALSSSLPNTLPSLQSTFTRSTNSHYMGNFTKLVIFLSPHPFVRVKCLSLPLPRPISRFRPKFRLPHMAEVTKTKLNSVALVRKRTIPTERPPLSAK
jgi:hypothetical protein